MKKIKLLLLISAGFIAHAQDSAVLAPAPVGVEETDPGYTPENPTLSGEERAETEFRNRSLKPGFKEDYRGTAFDYDRVPPQRNFRLPAFELQAGLLNFLMYVVLAAILVIVIYFILRNAGGISFGRERKKIKYDVSGESGEENLDEIRDNDFEQLIRKAKADSDYRKAVRYYYLWVLQKLSERNLIRWDKDKTDYEYLLELKNPVIREGFSVNTYIYDHTWYGNFDLDLKEFEMAEAVFQKTLKKIN